MERPALSRNGFRRDAAVASGEKPRVPPEPHAVRARQMKRVVAYVQEKIERALAAANRDFAAEWKDLPYDIPAGLGGIPPPGVRSLLDPRHPLGNHQTRFAPDVGLKLVAVTAEHYEGGARLRVLVIAPIRLVAE